MVEAEVAAVVALLNPLLRALEMLAFVARHLHPPGFASLMASIGTPDADLQSALAKPQAWPEPVLGARAAINAASDATLLAFSGLREALRKPGDVRGTYRALRKLPQALEALYPLAGVFAPVNSFFLDPALRADAALLRRFLHVPVHDDTGVKRFAEGERDGFWVYVPENYVPDRPRSLVMALHGGNGTGRQFLWSWLRDARSCGAILVAPNALGSTWALTGSDADTPNLTRILEFVRSRWNVDASRLLLTGMSDGGTFTYVSGLDARSPFTHLAPVSAAFHPLLAEMADPDRTRGLPVHVIHGALDWMFPVHLARQAQRMLSQAGAVVTYREIADLSHTYPRELNRTLLHWLDITPVRRGAPAA
jgi:phospholipase/carboxylesterase